MFPSSCPICNSNLDPMTSYYYFNMVCNNNSRFGHYYSFSLNQDGSYISESTTLYDFKLYSTVIYNNSTASTLFLDGIKIFSYSKYLPHSIDYINKLSSRYSNLKAFL